MFTSNIVDYIVVEDGNDFILATIELAKQDVTANKEKCSPSIHSN